VGLLVALTQVVQLRGCTVDTLDSRVSAWATSYTRGFVPVECRATAVVGGAIGLSLNLESVLQAMHKDCLFRSAVSPGTTTSNSEGFDSVARTSV
jgi:hypothetical protein